MKRTQHPLSLRLSPAELQVVDEAATKLGVTKTELIKRATLAAASKAGVALRTTEEERIYVRCSADERVALRSYAQRNELQSLSVALQTAARATLVARGDLVLPAGSYPDMDTGVASMRPAAKPRPDLDTLD